MTKKLCKNIRRNNFKKKRNKNKKLEEIHHQKTIENKV